MRKLEYTVRFTTPAFLGNAEQKGQWRTPPFKALIRQWWRVVKARDFSYDHHRLLEAEKRLFGAAAEEGKPWGRSKVLIRLDEWREGTLSHVDRRLTVYHPEAGDGQGGREMGANLYLGYGPVNSERSAIASDATPTKLQIRCPEENLDELQVAMQLAAWFGTLGSRSRNGWGALQLEGESVKGFADLDTDTVMSVAVARMLSDCLDRDWPHALGSDADGAPLVWRLLRVRESEKGQKQLVAFDTWQEVMRELARIKIAFRTSGFFEFNGGGTGGHPVPQARHILAYPAGRNHTVAAQGWAHDGRLASQLRFKLLRHGTGYAGVIAHFPCALPAHMAVAFPSGLPDQLAVWQEIHRLLGEERKNGLIRIK